MKRRPSVAGARTSFDVTEPDIVRRLERRLGRVHARQRLGIEHDHEEHVFGKGLSFFHLENWYSAQKIITAVLTVTGLLARGRRNAWQIAVVDNRIALAQLPRHFHGFTILQISDMHADMNPGVMSRLVELLPSLRYDICVLTGDFRGRTYGPFGPALSAVARVREHITGPVYGVLGNHDTVRMLPDLEAMGIVMLLNESVAIRAGDEPIYLAGIDDAHYYEADNLEKAAAGIPRDACAILLSHTPEIYRHAAHADFSLLLTGHTHGGQMCLPGSIPILLDAAIPRRLGAGLWRYHSLIGYTSVGVGSSIVPVRFNCPPEITLHRLECPDESEPSGGQ